MSWVDKADAGMLQQLGSLCGRAMGFQIIRARHNVQTAGTHQFVMQARIIECAKAKSDVGFVFQQIDDLVIALQLYFNFGV